MYVKDYIRKLSRQITRIGNKDFVPLDRAVDIIRELGETVISWSEEDFRSRAIDKTSETEWDEYYNKNTFGTALKEMIARHDASIGISWDTIDYYLDTYCKIKDYDKYKQYKN